VNDSNSADDTGNPKQQHNRDYRQNLGSLGSSVGRRRKLSYLRPRFSSIMLLLSGERDDGFYCIALSRFGDSSLDRAEKLVGVQ